MLEGDFEIHNAICVDEAIKKLKTGQYDIIISDYEMPQKTGLEFLKELREEKNVTPFILFTGKGREEVAIKALNLGADGYFNKQGSPETVYGELVHGVKLVVTNKKAEAELKESEEKNRQLVSIAHEGIIALNSEEDIVFANPHMSEILGFQESEIIGKSLFSFIPEIGVAHAQYYLNFCKEGVPGEFEFEFIRKDGELINVLFSTSIIRDNEGRNVGTMAVVLDITNRKKAELSLQENHRNLELMNEKLNVVGALIRHDIRNKLSSVTANTYLLKKKYADQTDLIDGLDRIENAVKESVKIFEFARIYDQLGVEKLKYIEVEQTLNEAVALFSGLNFKVKVDCPSLSLLADSFLRQLFYNFIDNTRKYGKKTTEIKVYNEISKLGELRLFFEDDGVGITEQNKENLFKEGFSTGGSTGFGLHLSKKMIDIYGWQIQEISKPGEGAKILLTIPIKNLNGKDNFIFKT